MKLANIEWDTSIQCRAQIDDDRVHEYAMQMAHGDEFPPIEVYGTADECWIGDGWHRVLAVKLIGTATIAARVHPGGRLDALKHALGANKDHGLRRTNADKRYCVEIALREFPKLTDRAIGELCGVDHKTVAAARPDPGGEFPQQRTGSDGKQYSARRTEAPEEDPEARGHPMKIDRKDWVVPPGTPIGPDCFGLDRARLAIGWLADVAEDDGERTEAFAKVRMWLDQAQGQAATKRFLTAVPVPWETLRVIDESALDGRIPPSAVLANIASAIKASAASLAQMDPIDIKGGWLEELHQQLAEINRQVRRLGASRTKPARRVTQDHSSSPTTAPG